MVRGGIGATNSWSLTGVNWSQRESRTVVSRAQWRPRTTGFRPVTFLQAIAIYEAYRGRAASAASRELATSSLLF